jgi:hypothetical protein
MNADNTRSKSLVHLVISTQSNPETDAAMLSSSQTCAATKVLSLF